MPKENLHKHTLNLREGDYERIQDAFAERNLGAAVVIRHIVSKFVDQITSNASDEELLAIKGVSLDEHG